jgi:hypothetical protein
MLSEINKLDCFICYTAFDCKDYLPTILYCGHTICRVCCIKMSDEGYWKCPMCKKEIPRDSPMTTNYIILDLIPKIVSQGEECRAYYCPNGHLTSPTKQITCNQHVNEELEKAYLCIKCDKYVCENIHPDEWLFCGNLIPVDIGSLVCISNQCKVNTGLVCWYCNFFVCYKCLRLPVDKKKCHLGHNLKWINKKGNCIVGNHTMDSGYSCSHDCLYSICVPCRQNIPSLKCPNKHKTKWTSSPNNCKLCTSYKSGFICEQCVYFICDTCNKTDFNIYKTQVRQIEDDIFDLI